MHVSVLKEGRGSERGMACLEPSSDAAVQLVKSVEERIKAAMDKRRSVGE